MRHRAIERDWPVFPVSLLVLRHIIYQLARVQWAQHNRRWRMPPFNVDNPGALRSAVVEPFQAVGATELYPSIPAKAACLFRGLVKNHGLRDGNKRLAVTATGVFLMLNGRAPTFTEDELWKYALRVARHHGPYPVAHIEGWIRRHSRRLSPELLAKARAVNERLYDASGDLVHHLVYHETETVLTAPMTERQREFADIVDAQEEEATRKAKRRSRRKVQNSSGPN